MKRLLMVTLFLVVASLPAYADIECFPYIDTIPSSDPNYNFCYDPGGICFQCVDVQAGTGCAADALCTPNGRRMRALRTQLARLSPAQTTGRVQVAAARRGSPSRSDRSSAIRPISMRVARLNHGNLL